MKLDLGSFAFGAETQTPGGNPSWGTSLGQSKPELKLTYPGYECIIEGMIYKSIPTSKVFMPIGKGGHVYNGIEDEGIQIAAMFDKVFVNETRINANYILVIYKDSSNSWDGRRTLKYSDKIEYRVSEEQKYSNANFVAAVEDALQMEEGASWIVSDLYVANQDELHLLVGVVNPNGPEIFADNEARKKRWLEVIQANYDDNPDYLEKLELGFYKYSPLDSSIPLQQIFYGAPGTGKSHRVNQITNEHPSENVFRTTFHPDSDYSTFVGCYKPTKTQKPVRNTLGQIALDANKQEIFESVITYKFVPQTFLKAYLRAYQTDEPVFLIIEEINRGNCAQIFGDLFQLLDRKNAVSEYPIKADEDLRQFIIEELGEDSPAIANGELCLPSNLYIWATMNTSDQSLFPIDSAFKRRWEWKYIPINTRKENWNILVNGKAYSWSSFLENINEQIGETTNSEDKKLGFYFCKATNNTIDADRFVSKVLFYIYNDVFKDYGFDKAFFKDNTKVMTFQSYYNMDGSVNEQQVALFLDNLQVENAKSAPEGLEDDEPQESAAELSKTQQARKDFWQAFLTYANANNAEYRECFSGRKTASTDKWYNFFIGQKKCHLCVEQTRSKKELMIGLYGEQSKEDYFKLLPYRQEIEQELGFSLDWREMPTKQSSYIVEVTPNIDFDDASKRNEIFDFIIDRLLRMRTTFLKFLAK